MPLTSHGSYILTLTAFEGHWAALNAERGGAPATDLKLPDGRVLTSEEQVVQPVSKTLATLDTTFGLGAAGAVSLFKVYVVLNSTNEKGSNSVKVTRV